MLRLLCISLIGLSLIGCAGREPLRSTARLTVIEGAAALPSPIRGDLVAADRPSLIGPLDTISVDIFGVPDLSKEMQVDASGRIAMPLIGTIDAGGLTSRELGDEIADRLRGEFVRDPDVTINIKNSVSQFVTIDGEVEKPGLYPVTNQMTLLRAVASAEGLTEFARKEDVVILRTVEGQRLAGLYSIDAIRRGVYDDPPIFANDVVVVGDSPQRRLLKDLLTIAPAFAGPIIAILQR